MAFYGDILSFHWMDAKEAAACRLLLVRQIADPRPHTIATHSHDFWQLEIPLKNGFTMADGEEFFLMKPGDFAIIPPGRSHEFRYTRKKTAWFTIRFSAEGINGVGGIHIGKTGEKPACIVMSIRDILLAYKTLSPEMLHAVENLLAALLAELFNATKRRANSLPDRIMKIVDDTAGRPITISQIADRLGMSVNHVTTSFRNSAGRPLKNFIDDKRLGHATRLLAFTSFSISEISDQMGFPDIFSFSRFFRRMTGMSPRQYRKSNR